MPGTTPVYGIPYPIASDPLDDAVSVIPQAEAMAIESTVSALLGVSAPGSWQPLTFAGFTNLGGFQNLNYRKIGNVVHLRGAATNTSGALKGAGTSLATLPVGFRPQAATRMSGVRNTTGATGNDALLCIDAGNNGVLTLRHDVPATTYLMLDGMYFYID